MAEKMNKMVYTVDEICEMLSIGRSSAYALVRSEKFEVRTIGRSIRIVAESFDKWLKNNNKAC